MISDSTIALLGIFVGIGGLYPILYQVSQKINSLQMEFATCPYHKKGIDPGSED